MALLCELIQFFADLGYNITGLVGRVVDLGVKMIAAFCDVLETNSDVGEHLFLLFLPLLGKNEVHVQDLVLAVFKQIGLLGELAVGVLSHPTSS